MEKTFKGLCVLMSAIILLSSLSMFFAIGKSKGSPKIDLFSCNDIVQNINNMELNMTSVIYIKNSKGKWTEYKRLHGNENRIWVSIDKIPQQLKDAFISIEDQRFYSHSGVDWKRTTAAFLNYLPFVHLYSSNQGGSTITQQLIKNITSDNDQKASRKFREIARALLLEKMISKDTILEAYLNTISLGSGICGVQVAANYYFNKNVDELSLVECAALAGITKNPSLYNPDLFPKNNKERRQTVLDKMLELGKISEKEYKKVYNANIVIDKSQKKNFEIPVNNYFVDTLISNVTENLQKKYKCSVETASSMLYNGGYKIYSTVNPEIQSVMEDVYTSVNTYFYQRSRKNYSTHVESAMTIMDYKGHILGIVGGTGKKTVNRGLNRAYSSPRQPGSTMKPLGVYTLAIDKGFANYSSFVDDKPLDGYYPDGKKGPKEWYGYYEGRMTLKRAIERSANTIPCWLLKDIGIENSYNFLTKKLKLNHLNKKDKNMSSLALGGCQYGITTTESAAAYSIFGNGGKYFEPVTYYKIVRPTGEVILENDKKGTQVINPATSTIMNMLLQNVVYGYSGTGRGISGYSSMKAYAKTGTSSESNDLWMVAGTPYYVGSVWYGFDNPETVYNGGAAATVWKTIMQRVHSGLKYKEFKESDKVVKAKYCTYTGMLAGEKCYSTADGYFVPKVGTKVCDGKHWGLGSTYSEYSSSSSSNSSNTSSKTSSANSHSSASSGNSSVSSNNSSAASSSTSQGDTSSGSSSTSSEEHSSSSDVNPSESQPSTSSDTSSIASSDTSQ